MTCVIDNLESIVESVLSELKDFQKATVDRIFDLYNKGQKRILVSDEVGLGKTLIARGLLAKIALKKRNEGKEFFKVVYVCSNATIAEQNLRKLSITPETLTFDPNASRLSMLHLAIFKQEINDKLRQSFLQLIPITPGTSFKLTSRRSGRVEERALMYAIIKQTGLLKKLDNNLRQNNNYTLKRALQNGINDPTWDNQILEHNNNLNRIKENSKIPFQNYIQTITDKLDSELKENIFGKAFDDPKDFIAILRLIFARISVNLLNPDLVILDEFQRFKDLINFDDKSNDDMNQAELLAHQFFNTKNLNILLLSATPYKLYCTLQEIDNLNEDEQFSEFHSVMKFLNEGSKNSTQTCNNFKDVWRNYTSKLNDFSINNAELFYAKEMAENAMYQVECRTERVSEHKCADIIDSSSKDEHLEVNDKDFSSFINIQNLINTIEPNNKLRIEDFVKSCPYILSFMREYKLKLIIEQHFKDSKITESNNRYIKSDHLWIDVSKINNYEKLPNTNAKLSKTIDSILQNNIDKLLWLPPSKPYYKLNGVFEESVYASKSIIFSAWEMVPRMLSCLISYEVERKTIDNIRKQRNRNRNKTRINISKSIKYFAKNRYPQSRMNFSINRKHPEGMNLICFIYPSKFLSECYNPISELNNNANRSELLNPDKLLKKIKDRVYNKLSSLSNYKSTPKNSKNKSSYDERWYYLAPFLLDDSTYVNNWIENQLNNLHKTDYDKSIKNFTIHLNLLIEQLKCIYNRELFLGNIPPDLIDILANLSLASPAVCLNRTFKNYVNNNDIKQINLSTKTAKLFLQKMNSVEATATVEAAYRNKDAHWKNFLLYCRDGCLQAVFDEFAHLLAGGFNKNHSTLEYISNQIEKSMELLTTNYNIDYFEYFKERISNKVHNANNDQKSKTKSMRSHFAVAFIKGDQNDEKDINRKSSIISAFNSPFRPFVLSSTSIGQEGLDFHYYCRRIVHWNLPSNPIDLEQREGRINRFKCLAIRHNIAKRYGNITFKNDIWNEMFDEAAKKEKQSCSSDLIPFWGLSNDNNMVKIERVVPMYPFSSEVSSYERLIKILNFYRLTLGQPRQEELLEFLIAKTPDPEKLKNLFFNLSPFYKNIKNNS